MRNFFRAFGHTLHELFTSKKFLAASGSAVGAIMNGMAPGTAILAAGVAYVTGQGMADFGKSAKGKEAGKP